MTTRAAGTVATLNLRAMANLIVAGSAYALEEGARIEAWEALTGTTGEEAVALAQSIARQDGPAALLTGSDPYGMEYLVTVWGDGTVEAARREPGTTWGVPATLHPAP